MLLVTWLDIFAPSGSAEWTFYRAGLKVDAKMKLLPLLFCLLLLTFCSGTRTRAVMHLHTDLIHHNSGGLKAIKPVFLYDIRNSTLNRLILKRFLTSTTDAAVYI